MARRDRYHPSERPQEGPGRVKLPGWTFRLVCIALVLCGASAFPEPASAEAPTLRIEEDLVLLDSPEAPLGHVRDVAVDSEGNIYLLDTGFDRVRVYSADGGYRTSIGREGEGPGDFSRPACIEIGPDDKIYVAGSGGTISILDRSGQSAGSIRRKGVTIIRSMAFDETGRLFTSCLDLHEHTVIDVYSGRPGADTYVKSFGESFAVATGANLGSEAAYGGGFLDVGDDGLLYYVQMAPQLVRIYRPDGTLAATHAAGVKESPVPPDPKPFGKGVSFGAIPMSTPIVSLPGGRYLVGQGYPSEDGGGYRSVVDVYDAEGTRLYTYEHPGPFSVKCRDRQNRIYVLEERDDLQVVVRYRMEL